MSKKFVDTSKLMAATPRKTVAKSASDDEVVSAIHKSSRSIRTSLDIPEDIHKQIKMLSVERGISMKDLMLQFFVEGLESNRVG
ncbi:MAG: hypothetical protein H6577_28250 [Lewinellaceae bacterium]|nr:hypothetical protein [Saprospiraceae bacterium]MCB9342039.1 hypothetical protein [Lewinellaceae bacterium]